MLGYLHPDINHPVLEILEVPEQGLVDPGIAVPALVLTSRKGVHIEDGVESLGGACVHNPVDKLETLLLDDGWIEIVHEMAVVNGDSNAVETQRGEKLGVGGCEEVFEKLVAQLLVSQEVVDRETGTAEQKSETLSKKKSYFSRPRTSSMAARISDSWPG